MYPLVAARGRHRCEYCHAPEAPSGDRFELDHIVPRARGGSDEPPNLALACRPCNRAKGVTTTAVDPATGKPQRLFDPRRDRWEEHFSWGPDYTELLGRTAVGRATVAALRFNDGPRQVARAFWFAYELIP